MTPNEQMDIMLAIEEENRQQSGEPSERDEAVSYTGLQKSPDGPFKTL